MRDDTDGVIISLRRTGPRTVHYKLRYVDSGEWVIVEGNTYQQTSALLAHGYDATDANNEGETVVNIPCEYSPLKRRITNVPLPPLVLDKPRLADYPALARRAAAAILAAIDASGKPPAVVLSEVAAILTVKRINNATGRQARMR